MAKALRDEPANRAILACKVAKVCKVVKVASVCKVTLVNRARLDPRVCKHRRVEIKVPPANKVDQASKDIAAHKA